MDAICPGGVAAVTLPFTSKMHCTILRVLRIETDIYEKRQTFRINSRSRRRCNALCCTALCCTMLHYVACAVRGTLRRSPCPRGGRRRPQLAPRRSRAAGAAMVCGTAVSGCRRRRLRHRRRRRRRPSRPRAARRGRRAAGGAGPAGRILAAAKVARGSRTSEPREISGLRPRPPCPG